ncbi:transcription factor bHLH112-like [Olea europaea subsp. europaea]|uniref:Transcription factor bHLH112-like n=1 Tax=Olea europaea subsp. europaea TaxID=158383 RepID=A0A8S0RTC2_OLEEU|nr:transcription factor bHLH112-like [Olea europaea subsp. europaea]
MAEELIQGGVCGGNWWNPARSLFGNSLPCSSTINDMGSFGWPNDEVVNDSKRTWSGDKSNSDSDGQKFQQPVIDHWNQNFLQENGISEGDYSHIKQVNQNSDMNYQQQTGIDCPQINHMDWNSKNFSTDDQNPPFILNSASDSYTSSFLQTLFDTDSDQPQQYLSDSTPAINFSSTTNYQVKSKEFLPPLSKQKPVSHLQFSDSMPFLGTSNDFRASLFASTQAQLSPTLNPLRSESKKTSTEQAFKRSRIETPSPLPTFKVRKEKLGDRITALQQLVSPFGKTDTASVLQEAIEYIKFLHGQVSVLSTSYLKNESPVRGQQVELKVHVCIHFNCFFFPNFINLLFQQIL